MTHLICSDICTHDLDRYAEVHPPFCQTRTLTVICGMARDCEDRRWPRLASAMLLSESWCTKPLLRKPAGEARRREKSFIAPSLSMVRVVWATEGRDVGVCLLALFHVLYCPESVHWSNLPWEQNTKLYMML